MTRSQATPASSQIITMERMISERGIEIERLHAQVEVLSKTIDAARAAMAAAPAWHEMHRVAIDQLKMAKYVTLYANYGGDECFVSTDRSVFPR